MRILYVIDSLVPGGAERSLVAMLTPLRQRGVEPIVAHLSAARGLQAAVDRCGVERIVLGSDSRRGAARRLSEVIQIHAPDLVHTTLFESDLAGRIAGARSRTPVVSTLANVAYGPEQRSDSRISPVRLRGAQLADVATARLVRRFHAVSEVVAEVMARRLLIPRGRVEVVVRGRDPEQLGRRTLERRGAVRRRLGLAPNEPVLLAVGRQEYQKGFDILLKAVGRLEERPTLLIAGREGSETSRLEQLASRLGPSTVRLLGHRDDVADLCCAADLAVFPSRWEGLPGAVIEAMALEVPVLASDIPQHREVLGTSVGLVQSDDPNALATSLRDTLGALSSDYVRDRTTRGRQRFETTFTIDAVAEGMLQLYRHALR